MTVYCSLVSPWDGPLSESTALHGKEFKSETSKGKAGLLRETHSTDTVWASQKARGSWEIWSG